MCIIPLSSVEIFKPSVHNVSQDSVLMFCTTIDIRLIRSRCDFWFKVLSNKAYIGRGVRNSEIRFGIGIAKIRPYRTISRISKNNRNTNVFQKIFDQLKMKL